MLNLNFSEKGLGLVSPRHSVYDFSRKMFLMLYWSFGNLGIGMSVSALASASASAFEYNDCLLHCINRF